MERIKVKYMNSIFMESNFDQDISNWNTSQVINMDNMFYSSKFTCKNGTINNWDVSTSYFCMKSMFEHCSFNKPLDKWDVSNVKDMSYMFFNSKFNNDISTWDTSNVKDMSFMFSYNNNFDSDISNWDVSNVVDMKFMFSNSIFNGNISKWNVKNVICMERIFSNSKFNGEIFNNNFFLQRTKLLFLLIIW